MEGFFRIGTVLKTKGLKGELNFYIDFEDLEKIKFQAVYVDMAGKLVPYYIKSLKYPLKNTAVFFV